MQQVWRDLSRWERRAALVGVGWLVAYTAGIALLRDVELGRLVLGDVVYLGPIAAALALALVVVWRGRGDRPLWVLLVLILLMWLAGDTAWAFYSVTNSGQVPSPGLPDVFYLANLALCSVGGLVAFRRATGLRRFRGVLDGVVVSVSVMHLAWDLLIAPQMAGALTLSTALVAAYPLLNISGVVIALSVGVSGHRAVPASTLLAAASLVLAAGTNLVWTYLTLLGQFASGAWLDLGWQAAALLLAGAAVRVLTADERQPDVRRSSGDYALVPLLTATAATAVIVLRDMHLGHLGWSALTAVVIVLVGLTGRLWLTLRDRELITKQLDQALRTSERLAVTDPLTGLYNRRFLEEVLHLQASQPHPRLGVLVLDVDNFKTVNDTFGHSAGDAVLVEVATRLSRALRDGDVLARYGGEEFAAVLPGADPEAAQEIAERCQRALADRPVQLPDGRQHTVTVSVGAGALPDRAGTVSELMQAADRALYRAKETGRDRVVLARADPDEDPGEQELRRFPGLQQLADVVDARLGPDEHSTAAARWVGVLADALALPAEVRARAVLAARLHDLGKLTVPEAILTKTAALTDPEWAQVQQHPALGAQILTGIPGVAHLAPLVRAHHERWDGTGYPDRLAGPTIPVEARQIAVCDSWAAMCATRCYSSPRSQTAARQELARCAGTQFDPDIVTAFLDLHAAGLVGQLTSTATATPPPIPVRTTTTPRPAATPA